MENRITPGTTPRIALRDALLRGALAGTLGAVAMTVADRFAHATLLPPRDTTEPPELRLVQAEADRRGAQLSRSECAVVGEGAHIGLSAAIGALYGAIQSRLRLPPLLHGLLLGGLIYGAGYPGWGLLPKRGALPPPSQLPLEQALLPVGTHAVFGLATAAAFERLS